MRALLGASAALVLWISGCEAEPASQHGATDTAERAPAELPLRVALITDIEGVLEPCGCAGRPLGGLDRLAGALAALRAQPGPLVAIAAGNLLTDARGPRDSQHSAQRRRKAETTAAILRSLKLDALVPGAGDLRHAPDALAELARDSRTRMLGQAAPALLPLGRDGLRLQIDPPGDADSGTRVRVESASGTALTTWLEGSEHAESLWLVELRNGPSGEWVADATLRTLDEMTQRDPRVTRVVSDATSALALAPDVTGESPNAVPPDTVHYVGSRTCAACHIEAFLWWQTTRHARAYQSLEARGLALDLDCIGCHVTGFGAPGGARLGALQELQGVGCESCHGPGSRHADNPQARVDRPSSTVEPAICGRCHDRSHGRAIEHAQRLLALRAPGHGLAERTQ